MNWINPVPHTAATTFAFSSVCILLLWWCHFAHVLGRWGHPSPASPTQVNTRVHNTYLSICSMFMLVMCVDSNVMFEDSGSRWTERTATSRSSGHSCASTGRYLLRVVDPNTLTLDSDPSPRPDPDPGLCYQFWKKKMKNNHLKKFFIKLP